ncbi:SGNH/GDSL hydrolase family protein [Actinacidiphila glaucinigra]|uniref:SGNH/GDSL hydrolase family protein n=1 Tax=Actinacidiphila glaucinigra TaxID=235986 RepID=UPI002DD9358A|nr:SGNH/GDSL hydrolase family protein [Actinacidiphila glaucinigra]WSD61917.1 SGNH/GDSL hydrolase family protein [Actinacidiphila glaucinigra]
MARSTGYALLAGIVALAAVISAAILVTAGRTDASGRSGGPVVAAGLPGVPNQAAPAASGSWVGTWSTSPVGGEPNAPDGYAGWSIRNVVHTSVGGTSARIHLSNLFGRTPLQIGRATVAVAAAPGSPAAAGGTMRSLTFGGRTQVRIPAGGSVVSDPVQLAVPQAADLLVTTYTPQVSGPVTYHPRAQQTSFMAFGERAARSDGAAYTTRTPYWRYVTGVDVFTRQAAGSVVLFGDSITDGITSTPGANHRWPDRLATRLRGSGDRGLRLGVLNQGISGNRVLRDGENGGNPSGLSRLERDALSQTGVRTLVVELGINDVLRPPQRTGAQEIVSGLREIVARGHERGLRVLGATLAPCGGHAGYNTHTEAVRQQVNAAIRAGTVFDEVIDFDRALRDPNRPSALLPAYDSGDHLHPSDAGFLRMAETVQLSLLKGGAAAKV